MLYAAPTNPFHPPSAYLGRAGVLMPWGVLAFGGRAANAYDLETQIVWRVRAVCGLVDREWLYVCVFLASASTEVC